MTRKSASRIIVDIYVYFKMTLPNQMWAFIDIERFQYIGMLSLKFKYMF